MVTYEDVRSIVPLLFASIPDDDIAALVQALPMHLSGQIEMLMGDRSPFMPKPT